MTDERHQVTIDRLGAQGDGVATTLEGDIFIAGALPGEQWSIGGAGAPQRLTDSPERRQPICRHFGTCGGCVAQHMSEPVYRAWKHGIVTEAFAHRRIAADVAPLEGVPLQSRRRAVLGIAHRGGAVQIGLREGGQHRLVDLMECPVLDARVTAALPGLRRLAAQIIPVGDGGRLMITATDSGLDVALSTGTIRLDAELKARLAAATEAAGLARLEVEGEVIAARMQPRLTLSGVTVEPLSGIFLQAVAAAEARLVALAVEGVGKARRIADLFCGIGTFTFALARRAAVLAADGDKAALAVLSAAQRTAHGLKPIEVKRRDLFREPLSPLELAGYDAVVMDPPRAGAKAQSEALARSKVARVVMVSCNPATLARDCRILLDAGFSMGTVTPIDQFAYSPHVEAVVVLDR